MSDIYDQLKVGQKWLAKEEFDYYRIVEIDKIYLEKKKCEVKVIGVFSRGHWTAYNTYHIWTMRSANIVYTLLRGQEKPEEIYGRD